MSHQVPTVTQSLSGKLRILNHKCYVPCLILVLRAHLCFPFYRLLPYLYLPDRSTAYTGLTLAVAAISMLSSYRPNTSTSVHTMPTFLFRLAFPRLSNHSLASCYESSPVFLVRVSQFFRYLLRLFCYLLSTILRISQPISKLLTHLLTVL
jgi:hypothetical protein